MIDSCFFNLVYDGFYMSFLKFLIIVLSRIFLREKVVWGKCFDLGGILWVKVYLRMGECWSLEVVKENGFIVL